MANLTPEQEQEVRDNIKKYGSSRPYRPSISVYAGNESAKLYNRLHNTNVVDDDALKRLLENERELKRLMEE